MMKDHSIETKENQANSLKELVREINSEEGNEDGKIEAKTGEQIPNIDVLNLPPRKKVHQKNNKKLTFKVKGSFLRLLFVIVLAIILCMLILYVWEEDLAQFIRSF